MLNAGVIDPAQEIEVELFQKIKEVVVDFRRDQNGATMMNCANHSLKLQLFTRSAAVVVANMNKWAQYCTDSDIIPARFGERVLDFFTSIAPQVPSEQN